MTYPRLHVDDVDLPDPIPFPGRSAERVDAVRQAEDALDRAEASLHRLSRLVDDGAPIATLPLRPDDGDDDGPWAA